MRMDVHQVNDLLQALQDQRNALANEVALLKAELSAAKRKIGELEKKLSESINSSPPAIEPVSGAAG